MKLIIITQKVDLQDSILGFFHKWLEKFAGKADSLFVICLEKGEYKLPDNVEVFSLGKEKGYSKTRQFFRLQRALLKYLPEADGVFFHMCPIYVLASALLLKIYRKRSILWFVHRSLNMKLRTAAWFVDKILTTSPEGCRLKNRKVEVIGHGIDLEQFTIIDKPKGTRIVSVGRISAIKDYLTLVEAASMLNVQVDIVGEVADRAYFEKVKRMIKEKGMEERIHFVGKVMFSEMPSVYQKSDLLINLCPTGGMDKAVLEAMASGTPVLVRNRAFEKDLGPYANQLIFNDAKDLAEKIPEVLSMEIGSFLRNQVAKNHNLVKIVDYVYSFFQKRA